jgi:hypothetical protein
MKPRDVLAMAKHDSIELMRKVNASHDAVGSDELVLAKKIAASDFIGFESLDGNEIDALINLLGYYWDDSDARAEMFIDFLTDLKNAGSVK